MTFMAGLRGIFSRITNHAAAQRLTERAQGSGGGRSFVRVGLAVLAGLVLLWIAGMAFIHRIDDDLTFRPATDQGSQAVATAAALLDREIARWTPNAPWFHPAASLDNMPNYQIGILSGTARFTLEMAEQLARTRGSSSIDVDLDRAAGLLRYDPTTWLWGQGNLVPKPTATSQYKIAVQHLRAYNQRLAADRAVYDRRADNLIGLLERIASDLGSVSASLDLRTQESNAAYFDREADDIFYNVKGRTYVYALLLRDIGADFDQVLREKQAAQIWANMLASLNVAAEMDPIVVSNGKQDGLLFPSHLTAQGFYLLRARTQMREAIDALVK